MLSARVPADSAQPAEPGAGAGALLTAADLLAGSLLVHDIEVPPGVLRPGQAAPADGARHVRLRPLKIATLALIARAARDDESLLPLLLIKEALVAPALSLDQVRQMHAGLAQFLVAAVNRISGLEADAAAAQAAGATPIGAAHVLLARHYGWTPAQVAELTPGQIAVYLAGLAPAEDGPRGDG